MTILNPCHHPVSTQTWTNVDVRSLESCPGPSDQWASEPPILESKSHFLFSTMSWAEFCPPPPKFLCWIPNLSTSEWDSMWKSGLQRCKWITTRPFAWALTQSKWCPYGKRKFRQRDRQGTYEQKKNHVSNHTVRRWPTEVRKRPQGKPNLSTPWFQLLPSTTVRK